MDITDYYKQFSDMKKLADEMIGTKEGVYFHPALINIICHEKGVNRSSIANDIESEYLMFGQERMLAMHFILNADQERNWEVIERHDRYYLNGVNNHPKTFHAAYPLLKRVEGHHQQRANKQQDGSIV